MNESIDSNIKLILCNNNNLLNNKPNKNGNFEKKKQNKKYAI